jgi:tyrosine-protein kinase Etk/Wzc
MTTQTNPYGYQELQNSQTEEDSTYIKRYLSLFLSNWFWFLGSLFFALIIAYGINRYSEKIYTVSSTLLIKDEKNGGGLSNTDKFMPGSNIFNSQQNLNNEIGILKSFRLNKRVIDSLPEFRIVYFGVGRRNIVVTRLYRKCPFKVQTEFLNAQPVNRENRIDITITSDTTYSLEIAGTNSVKKDMKFGERIIDSDFNFIINLRDPENFKYDEGQSNNFNFNFLSAEDLANSYRDKLNVIPIAKDASLVNLSSSGFVPEQEVDYLNKLMELYISQGLESKYEIADSTTQFINRQIKQTSYFLNEAEVNLLNFRLENKLINLTTEGNLIQSRLERIESEKTTINLQQQYYHYLKEYLNSKNETGDIISPSIMGITDQALSGLVQELALLQQKKKQILLNLNPDLPAVNLFEENIINARKTLSENVENSIIALDHSLEDVNRRLDLVNLEIGKLPGTERKMINIQRQFDINNTVYTYLLEKRAETGIARASNVSDNKIIDQAEIFNAGQIKPKPRGNNVKALILGLLIPGLIISLLYYFNNRIIDNEDIIKRTTVPIIGYISHSEDKIEIPVKVNPGSTLSESFRSIRTSLRYFIKETSNPVIAITSTISSEGKTFISTNLAAITALLGKKVLLIGLDLRKPRIHTILEIDNNEGMSTYLSSNCEYEEVIKETTIKNLFYATSGPIPPNPAELIDDERMKTFLERAKKEFDYIIIDTPPIAIVTDTLLLAPYTDINIFVVRQRFSSKNTLDLIQELYKTEKLKNMGIIINDISLVGYYGYGLRYGYYKGYGYSYGKNYYGKYSYGRYGYSDREHGYYNAKS